MRKLIRTVCVFFLSGLLLLGFSFPVFSWNQGRTFTFDPFLGLYQFDKEQRLDLRSYYGLRAGYNVTGNLGFETMFGYIPTETKSIDVEYRDVHVYRFGIDALFHFNPTGVFVPFLEAGIGMTYIDYPSEWKDRNHMLLDYGAGLKYYVSDTVALRGDIRQAMFLKNDGWRTNRECTVGVTFLIGGKTRSCAPVAAPPPAILVMLEDYHFGFDMSAVTREGADILDDNILILKANPKYKIRIAGYTSAKGDQDYNQKLSERRANVIRDYLIKGGIAPDRLKVIGYGEMRPAEYEVLPDNIYSREAKANMRVLFEVIVK